MEDYPVSVVIPYFNGSSFIVRALKSIAEQTLPALEVIIVDDGSHETELAFLQNLIGEFDFLLVSQSNYGQSAARNLGAKYSKGKLICFLDQDDWFLPHHINDLVQTFIAHETQPLVYGKYTRNYSCLTSQGFSPPGGRNPKIRFQDQVDLFKANLMIVPSCILVSKEVFDEVGGFDETLRGYEDDDIVIRVVMSGGEVIELPWAISVWSRVPTSSSHSKTMIHSQRVFFYKWQLRLQSLRIEADVHRLFLNRFSKVAASQLLRQSLDSKQSYLECKEFGQEILNRAKESDFGLFDIPYRILLRFFVALTERKTRSLAFFLVPILNALNSLQRR